MAKYDKIKNLGNNHWLLADFAEGKEQATLRTFEEWCYFYPQNCHTKYMRFRINPVGYLDDTFVTVVRFGSERRNAERFFSCSIASACNTLLEWLRNNNYTDENRPKL